MNCIIIGILSGSAHLWDPKMFTLIKIVGIIVAIQYVNKKRNLKEMLLLSIEMVSVIVYCQVVYITHIQSVPLATEPGISLIILPLMGIMNQNLKRTTDTFLFISHTTNVLLFKFRCNIFIGVRIIKEMPGSAASGTPRVHARIKFLY